MAAPITALNLQDLVAALRDKEKSKQADNQTPLLQRAGLVLVPLSFCVLVVVLLALLGLTWLGWLAGYGREERHVAWSVQPEPSLQQAAETLHRWREEGLLRSNERVFSLSPELGAYAAAGGRNTST